MTTGKGGARQQNKPASEMFRGDFVLVVSVGDYRKPRPALVVQSDLYNGTHHSVTICLVTSTLVDAPLFWIPIKPLKRNGLSVASQVMVDKSNQRGESKRACRCGCRVAWLVGR